MARPGTRLANKTKMNSQGARETRTIETLGQEITVEDNQGQGRHRPFDNFALPHSGI